MEFTSQTQLERYLMKKCRLALLKAQDEVYRIIKSFVYDYYKDYSPDFYQRTGQLLESLVESRIISTGKGYEAEVYFNVSGLNYVTGEQPTGEQVMAAATLGMHGAIGEIPGGDGREFKYVPGNTGVDIWSDPIRELDAQAIKVLVQMLISEGVPVR